MTATEVREKRILSNIARFLVSESSDRPDMVNHPPHYTAGGIECIDALRAASTPEEFQGFLKLNVIKYLWRANHKGGAEDLKKAAWYLDRLNAEFPG